MTIRREAANNMGVTVETATTRRSYPSCTLRARESVLGEPRPTGAS
jgi:hypothetical protein